MRWMQPKLQFLINTMYMFVSATKCVCDHESVIWKSVHARGSERSYENVCPYAFAYAQAVGSC